MKRQDPILIASPPRCGTTMLAGLLHYHGYWIGRGRVSRYSHTNVNFASENIDIKDVMKREAERLNYKNWHLPLPDKNLLKGTKSKIEKFVPHNEPWLVKTSWTLVFWKFWIEAYPEALWLFPDRSPEKVLDSMNRHPAMARRSDEQKTRFIDALFATREELKKHAKHWHQINVEKLVDKDEFEIKTLFEFIGIEPNATTISQWMKPNMLKR